jgi:flagellar hook assembly protein FlgD
MSETEFITVFPNPFNDSIQFSIQTPAKSLEIKIYNIAGNEVFRDLLTVPNTRFNYSWNGTDFIGQKLSSGIYVLILQGGEKLLSQKIWLLK